MISTDSLRNILLQSQLHDHVRVPGPKLEAILTELIQYRQKDPKHTSTRSSIPYFLQNILKKGTP